MSETMQQLQETVDFIRGLVSGEATTGIILGSGLGNLPMISKQKKRSLIMIFRIFP
jgi:purine nucleoside phosphorylase